MSPRKVETLSLRLSPDIKQLLRQAAEVERRSIASMIEIMVLDYSRQHGIDADDQERSPVRRKA